MFRTKAIIFIFLLVWLLPGFEAVGQRLVCRKAIVATDLSLYDLARTATFVGEWRKELGAENFTVRMVDRPASWRMELYHAVQGVDLRAIAAQALDADLLTCKSNYTLDTARTGSFASVTLRDSLPVLRAGDIRLIDSLSNGTLCIQKISVRNFDYDRSLLDSLRPTYERYEAFLRSPLCVLDTQVVMDDYFWGGASPMADLMTAFQAEAAKCNLSFYAPYGWFDSLASGAVYVADIERLLPFDNALVRVSFQGAELAALIEKSCARRFRTMRHEQSDLLRARTPAYLHTDLRGLPHTLDLSRFKGRLKVQLQPDSTYTVAMNSFHAKGYESQTSFAGRYRTLFALWLIARQDQRISQADVPNNRTTTPQHAHSPISISTAPFPLHDQATRKDLQEHPSHTSRSTAIPSSNLTSGLLLHPQRWVRQATLREKPLLYDLYHP